VLFTTNYSLKKYELTDPADLTAIGSNWDTIDTELKKAENKVGKTGDETIGGIKTFSSSPVVPEPTLASQVATKDYVDSKTVAGGNLTEATSVVLTITGGTGAVLGSGTTIQVKKADGTQAGFISSEDWTTFSSKQDSLGFTPENEANKVASFQATPTDIAYPSEKLVADSLSSKVSKTGNETIKGTKTFSTEDDNFIFSVGESGLLVPLDYVPTADNELANKKYVDSLECEVKHPIIEEAKKMDLIHFTEKDEYNGTVWEVKDFAELTSAITGANDWDIINLTDSFTITSTVSIDKSILITSNKAVILQSAGTGTDPTHLFIVIAGNYVYIDKNITIKQRKTTDTSVESAITNAGYLVCKANIEFMEMGLVNSGAVLVDSEYFKYTGATPNQHRFIYFTDMLDSSYIRIKNIDNLDSAVALCNVFAGVITNYFNGSLIVEGCKQLDPSKRLRQGFLLEGNFDLWTKAPSLYFFNNQFNVATSCLGILAGSKTLPLDNFKTIALLNNIQGYVENGEYKFEAGYQKGLFFLDGSGSLRDCTNGSCQFIIDGNIYREEERADYNSADLTKTVALKNVFNTNGLNILKQIEQSQGGTSIADWEVSKLYKVSDFVVYNFALYRCKEEHTSTAEFDVSKWDGISVDSFIVQKIAVAEAPLTLGQTVFTLPFTYQSAGEIEIYFDNILLSLGIDWIEDSNNPHETIILTSPIDEITQNYSLYIKRSYGISEVQAFIDDSVISQGSVYSSHKVEQRLDELKIDWGSF
jgi:hypothetical protein